MPFVKLNIVFIIYNIMVLPTASYYFVPVQVIEYSLPTTHLEKLTIRMTTMKPLANSERLVNVNKSPPVRTLKPNSLFISHGDKKINFNKSNNTSGPKMEEEGSFCRRSHDGQEGYCVLAHQCLHVVREHRLNGTKIDICTYRKNIPVICCPLANKNINNQRISALKCQEYHEALIVGGQITKREEYPHMAALGWTQDGEDYKWKCGGTLISDFFVLTAAHCAVSGGKAPDMVRLGAHNLYHTTADIQDRKVRAIYLHPKYHSSSYYHDIALLKLSKSVHFTAQVQPACLWQLPDLEIGSGIATGWGRTEFSGPKSDERKERRLSHGITDAQFCAGHLEGGKDTCQGDSGGPFYAELPELNCIKFVIGITSFGQFCGTSNSPGVYTKIYSYLEWIENIVFKV